MNRYIPRFFKDLVKAFLEFLSWDKWASRSWSQEGEDLVLRRIFEYRNSGFYIDVGAHHPKRFSNTYLFYRKGWSGINIDAMPGSMKAFNKCRPRDINLEIGISTEPGRLKYHLFNEPALNGFSSDLSEYRHSADTPFFLEKIIDVDVIPLRLVLVKHLKNNEIDFMSVDVEGLDLDVLRSNDWDKYRPKFLLVEILSSSIDSLGGHEITTFMSDNGYTIYAKLFNTVFFKDTRLYLNSSSKV